MKQSKVASAVEAICNIVVGFIVAVLLQVLIFPLYHISLPVQSNLEIALMFTVISIVRSYIIRRIFNRIS